MNRNAVKEPYATLAFLACAIAYVVDIPAVYIFGAFYHPGYNHLTQPMSVLGGLGSPVERPVSAWWVFIGVLFILFAAGYRRVYISAGRPYRIVFGALAVIALPFVLLRTFSQEQNSRMRYFSLTVAATGMITVLLFNISKVIPTKDTIFSYQGFWQRVFVLIYYVYIMVISYRMLQFNQNKEKISFPAAL